MYQTVLIGKQDYVNELLQEAIRKDTSKTTRTWRFIHLWLD
jgi:hypothetical protein